MASATITVKKNELSKMAARFETQVSFMINHAAKKIVDEAKARAPVVSGNLRDGIHAQFFNRLHAIAFSAAGYSGFVEFDRETV